MQTFLPHMDFERSAACLDRMRLGKQRVEAAQIFNILRYPRVGMAWENHPAVLMWKGYEGKLAEYTLAICREWIRRGYKDTIMASMQTTMKHAHVLSIAEPWWLGNPFFHASHRAALLSKADDHWAKTESTELLDWYDQFHWTEPRVKCYWWPTKHKIN